MFSSKIVEGSYVECYQIFVRGSKYQDFTVLQINLNEENLAEELRHRVEHPEYVSRMILYSIESGDRKYLERYYRKIYRDSIPCYSCNKLVDELYGPTPFTQVCRTCLEKVMDELVESHGEINLKDPTIPLQFKALKLSLERDEFIIIQPPAPFDEE